MLLISLCSAFIFFLLEIFIPGMFFLNFAIAALLCALIAPFIQSMVALIIIFCILSLLFIFILRPVLIKVSSKQKQKTGMEEKYVGKTALVLEDIDKNKGVITLYDERWQARNIEDGVILKGSQVEITGYESIIMKVKKVD